MATRPEPQPEFSRLVPLERLERLGGKEFTVEITAAPDERAALARRLGLLGLDRLSAALRLGRVAGKDHVRVTARLMAGVTQACVVSLEPVEGHIEEEFTLFYSLEAAAAQGEVVVEPEAEEPPESVVLAGIDLGEAVTQQLALALDPYPRAPDAELPRKMAVEPAAESPFAVLKSLKPGP